MSQKFFRFIKSILILLTIVLFVKTWAKSSKELHFAGDIWCPYMCNEATSKQQGYVLDMANEIFAKHNISIKFSIIPWARTLLKAEKGEIDGIVAAYKEGREDKYFFPSEDFGKSITKFYVIKDNHWFYHSADSLKSVRIGTILGYVYGGEIDLIHKYAKKVIPTGGENGAEKNIRKLQNGEIDVTIEDDNVTNYVLKKIEMTDIIKEAGSIGKKSGVYIGFPKILPESEKYAKILSDGLAQMKKTGRFQQILKNYNIKTKE